MLKRLSCCIFSVSFPRHRFLCSFHLPFSSLFIFCPQCFVCFLLSCLNVVHELAIVFFPWAFSGWPFSRCFLFSSGTLFLLDLFIHLLLSSFILPVYHRYIHWNFCIFHTLIFTFLLRASHCFLSSPTPHCLFLALFVFFMFPLLNFALFYHTCLLSPTHLILAYLFTWWLFIFVSEFLSVNVAFFVSS